MAIKSILLHLTQDSRNDARTETALHLALAQGAQIVALYTILPLQMPTYTEGYITPEIMDRYDQESQELAAGAKEIFTKAAEAAGVAFEWRTIEGLHFDSVAFNAHYSDLVVIGQPAPGDERAPGTAGLPGELVLSSGRPVLVVPYAGRFAEIGKRILVAWNGTREAARAVQDAMPLLQQADEVAVFGLNMARAEHIPGADIATHLARHGVRARVESSVAQDIAVSDALLNAISDLGYDMLVMGAYGHSRMRELALGGVTREILQHMTVPVLMSH
jgi:nucleotide-binding universal stress UspA family protein